MKFNIFKDIQWIPTSINHNQNSYNKDCIIGIPIYKDILSDQEKASLYQICNIIKNFYEICLICPLGLDLSEYNKIAYLNNIELSTLYCNKDYFKNTKNYSYLCETTNFYKCFSNYKYLFIYQLDGWIFENNLQEFIDLGVDYIGGPWHTGSFNFKEDTIGNGGISLRKISKFIEVCQKFIPEDFEKEYVEREDLFFCKTHRNKTNFKYPTIEQAVKFAVTAFGRYFVTKYNNGELPMCIHAWEKEIYLKQFINIKQNIYNIENNIKDTASPILQEINIIKQNKNIQKIKKMQHTNYMEDEEYASLIMDYVGINHPTQQRSKSYVTYQDLYYNYNAQEINNTQNIKLDQDELDNYNKHINILIVHYNTPYLTECLIKSINKFVGDNCTIYIFDNSDKEPFTYKQDNIVIFDNTKGQIIDFEKWLEQFPYNINPKALDGGKRISARHCISVDRCFDLINDNFLLLDSDILLVNNLIELYDTTKIFVGQLEYNTANIERLLPYCCFINVKACKKLNIRYFNKELMHGLNTGINDMYDTGASFYYYTKQYAHSIINLQNYIIHYKGASWDPNNAKNMKYHKNLTPSQWIENNKQYWKNNKVIYTCITGNYEQPLELSYIQPNFDYICFTDNINQVSKTWRFLQIPEELKNFSPVKQQRLLKICPHKFLKEYDESIWVDGNIDILTNMDTFINEYCNDQNKCVFIQRHPQRNCIYDEALACIKLKKDYQENINSQIARYKESGFQKNKGLVETGIIYRKHNNQYSIDLMNMWANELINGSHRDQLSFNYCLDKIGNSGFQYLKSKLKNSEFFKIIIGHHKNKFI